MAKRIKQVAETVRITGGTHSERSRVIRRLAESEVPLEHLAQARIHIGEHDRSVPVGEVDMGTRNMSLQPRGFAQTGPTWGRRRMARFQREVLTHEMGHVMDPRTDLPSGHPDWHQGTIEGAADKYATNLGVKPSYPEHELAGRNAHFNAGYQHGRS